MPLRTQKGIRSSEVIVDRDRLSEMPDDVIVRILSCMPIIDAVRTVLLRRFGNLCTLIHTLDFDMSEYLKNYCPGQKNGNHFRWFCVFVRNVLLLHQNLCIDSFHVCFDFDSLYDRDMAGPEITMWSRFALCRQAKEIRLSDEYNYHLYDRFILSEFTSQFLVTLQLDYLKYEGEFQVELGSLKKLSLHYVLMTEDNFQKFISGCPSLQELVIVNPYAMNDLTLSAPNIEKLSLILTNGHEWHNPELLYSPNLKNLYLEIKSGQLDIVDVSSVRNIYVKNLNFFMHHGDHVATINQVLVGRFEGIEVFRLSCGASKEFLHRIQNLQLLECRWRRIVLELQDFCESCLLGVYHLMNSLKHLEELVIYTTEDFKASADLLRVEHPCSYVTPQLKTITMHGYERSWKSQLQVVQVLLKSAAALDKFVIVPLKYRWKEADEPDFVKHLSSFPKASPSAKVIFA